MMSLATVVPGRYLSRIVDWGVREIEKLDGALEAWVSFDFKDQAGAMQSITWKGLVLRKDGERNKKTFDTLATCGLADGDMIRFMDDPSALNMAEPLDITIVDEMFGDKVYKNVEWVNKVGGGQRNKPEGEQKLSIQQKLARMGMGKLSPKSGPVKNYAADVSGAEARSAAGANAPDKDLGF